MLFNSKRALIRKKQAWLSCLLFSFCSLMSDPVTAQIKEQKDSYPESDARRLNGKVTEQDRLERLYRPNNGNPLNRSVRVLPSGESRLPLDNEDVSLDSALQTDNFKLHYLPMNPRQDKPDNLNRSANALNLRNSVQGDLWRTDDWQLDVRQRLPRWNSGRPCGRCIRPAPNFNDLDFASRHLQANMLVTPPAVAPPGAWSLPNNFPRITTELPQRPPLIPPLPPPAPIYEEKNVPWDDWYQKVSGALYQKWQVRGQEPGEATLSITVHRQRKVEATLLRSSNPSSSFKQNLLSAVTALNNSPVLEFPANSLKQVVHFNSVFSAGTDTAAGAYSERGGEYEHIRIRH